VRRLAQLPLLLLPLFLLHLQLPYQLPPHLQLSAGPESYQHLRQLQQLWKQQDQFAAARSCWQLAHC